MPPETAKEKKEKQERKSPSSTQNDNGETNKPITTPFRKACSSWQESCP
jgi:hypothetical protein